MMRAAIWHCYLGQQAQLDPHYFRFQHPYLRIDPIVDDAPAQSTKNSMATSGLPLTHASRSREPPSF
jgi:hypothetical protein